MSKETITNISDETIKRAANGDEGAFEAIYRSCFSFVSNVSYRIVSKKDEAEDVCQEVFITIYRKIGTFRGESSLKTWVYRITINCALKYAQRKSKENKGMVELNDNFPAESQTKDVRHKMDEQKNEQIVRDLLNKLSPDQKICIVLRSMEGLRYHEIAETLNIPINTVRSRIKRARETMMALRKEVLPHGL